MPPSTTIPLLVPYCFMAYVAFPQAGKTTMVLVVATAVAVVAAPPDGSGGSTCLSVGKLLPHSAGEGQIASDSRLV